MKKVVCTFLSFCVYALCLNFTIYAQDDYPTEDLIPDEGYRTILSRNDADSRNEIGFTMNCDINVSDGIVTYTPNDADNAIFFIPSSAIKAEETKKIKLRMKIPVKINELKIYFENEFGLSEERTFILNNIEPSDEFQTFYINTESNVTWTGTIDKYRFTIGGGIGEPFEIDYVYFYSDYNQPYTDDERCRLYDFNSKNYGFEGNQYVSDMISYNSELWAKIANSDASFTTESDFEIDAELIPQIKISYNNQTSGTNGKLYFTTDSEQNYNDKCLFNFESSQGVNECIIDTADNENWKGKITGLRFIPSDGDGIVKIDFIRLEKFICSVVSQGGTVSGKGNLYGEIGRMSVKAENTETGKVDFSENIRTESNGDFEFSFEIPDMPLKPIVYNLLFKGTGFSGTYKKKIVCVSADYTDKIFDEINSARTVGDSNLLRTLIEENYKPLNLQAEIFNDFVNEGQYTDELYTALLGKSAADKNELEEHMNEAAVKVRVKYMSADEWMQAIDNYDSYIRFKELSVYKTYGAVSDSVKKKIMSKMSAEHCTDFQAAKEAFQKHTVLTALSHAVAWGDVKNVLQINAELLNIDFNAVNRLKAPSEAYRQLAEKSFGTYSEVKSAFDKAVEEQKRKEASQSSSSSTGGGSSSGGNNGSSGAGIYMPIINTPQNNQPAVTPPPTPTATPMPEVEVFKDLSGFEWAKQDILELYDNGIISGTGNGMFEPAREVKREEFIKMLVSAFDIPLSSDCHFEDVPAGAWYEEYVGAAVKAGFAYGQGDIFGVGQIQSRQDVAVMAVRALNIENTTEESKFTDFEAIADYAKDAVNKLAYENILTGYDDGTFRPSGALTRAEAAVVINRIMGRSAN